MRRRPVLLFSLCCMPLVPVFGAAEDSFTTRFDVVSVKPAGPEHDGPSVYRTGPGTADPTRITFERYSMLQLLRAAYGVDWDQVVGPAWLATEYYAVDAIVPPGTTSEQLKPMWQALYADRFHLKAHLISKEFPIYELSIARNGPKLTRAGTKGWAPAPGFPVPGVNSRRILAIVPPRNVRQTFLGSTMTEFAQQLAWTVAAEGQSGWPGHTSLGRVIDKTGLTGTWDFTFEFGGRFQSGAWPPPLPEGETDTVATLFDALRQQLGLQLEEKKSRLDVLVVDSADKIPTAD